MTSFGSFNYQQTSTSGSIIQTARGPVETRSTPWDGWNPQVLSHEEKVLRLQVTMADLILVHVVDSTSVFTRGKGRTSPTNA